MNHPETREAFCSLPTLSALNTVACRQAGLHQESHEIIIRSSVNPFEQRLFICGLSERGEYRSQGLTHIVSVANPGAENRKPGWLEGEFLPLWFGDVVSEEDARQWKTRAPSIEDVKLALAFLRSAWNSSVSKILVTCDYGASRSPALAYVFVADELGAGRESDALHLVLGIREGAVPNSLVVRLADGLLQRNGMSVKPLKDYYSKLNAELWSTGLTSF